MCRKLIREFIEDGQADVAGEYARQIPQRIIARILGIDPEDGRRLVEEPEIIPSAVEGFLRAYSPVTMESIATQDPVLGDQLVKEGERIVLSFPASSRAPPPKKPLRTPKRSSLTVKSIDISPLVPHPPVRRIKPRPTRDANRHLRVLGHGPRIGA